jgi:hypothetical protein
MKKLLVAIVIGALLALPLSAMAMEKINGADLEDVTGQAGVSIGFGSTLVTEISFSSIAWGDPDGVAGAANEGWIIIDGNVGLTSTVNQGGILVMDVANAAGGDVTLNGVVIPSGHTFLALSLPSMGISVRVPTTTPIAIGFGTLNNSMGCTMGELYLDGLNVSMDSVSALYIWCH